MCCRSLSFGNCGLQRTLESPITQTYALAMSADGGTKTDRRPTVFRGVSSA